MNKSALSVGAALLLCMVAAPAQADDRVSSDTLDAMGFAGLVVMSDSDAMSVRGMGYSKSRNGNDNDYHGKKKSKSSAKASGKSWANVEYEGEKIDVEAEAGTRNEYSASGNHYASGDNFSEAKLKKSWETKTEWGDGDYTIETKTLTIKVEAGGWSSAKAH